MAGAGQASLIQKVRRLLTRPVDSFMRAHPEPNGSLKERDLFEGVEPA
jgi:hypothetical protein